MNTTPSKMLFIKPEHTISNNGYLINLNELKCVVLNPDNNHCDFVYDKDLITKITFTVEGYSEIKSKLEYT